MVFPFTVWQHSSYVQAILSQSKIMWWSGRLLHQKCQEYSLRNASTTVWVTDLPFPKHKLAKRPHTFSYALIGDLAMALGLLCHRHRQGDSVSACQLVMRSLGQTSESHDRSNDTAFFLFLRVGWGVSGSKLMGSSCGPLRSEVICFKLNYENRRTASIDWAAMGLGHTCIYVNASCLIFQPLLLILGKMN